MTDDHSILTRHSQETYALPFVFPNIAIETCNFCNRGCAFCPVGTERKPVRRMDEALFSKILWELAAFRYRGDICLQWYNEPLADKRLPQWTAMARLACPQSHIYCASNGDFLTVQLFDRLVDAGMDLIRVSQYDGHIQPNVRAVLDSGHHPDRLRVAIKGADVLTNSRGGSVVQLSVLQEPMRARCIRPDEQLIIDAHGNVPLCCNDYHVSYRIGNAREMTVLQLWNHPLMEHARAAVRAGDRSAIPVCRACNEPDSPYAAALPKGATP